MDTQDGLNPNILTAQDKENNTYAYNPKEGWFQVPEVYNPMATIDWDKVNTDSNISGGSAYLQELNTQLYPEKYPEVGEDFINDGSFNITQALYYHNLPEEQKFSSEAAKGQYWVGYSWVGELLDVAMFPLGNGGYGYDNYPEEYNNSGYIIVDSAGTATWGVPAFVYGGLWKVHLNSGEYSYVIATTEKNPTSNNPTELINLAHGFDQAGFEFEAKDISGAGRSDLLRFLNGLIKGGTVFASIIRPPEQLADGSMPPFSIYGGTEYFSFIGPNPTIGSRQIPGELISYFSPGDQAKIMEVLLAGFKSPENIDIAAPLASLPKEFANRILFTRVGTQ